jgi:hypothetical protein
MASNCYVYVAEHVKLSMFYMASVDFDFLFMLYTYSGSALPVTLLSDTTESSDTDL